MVKKTSKGAVKAHLDKENTIDCLNNALLQMRQDGELVGISLKKIEGSAKMTLKNDIPAAERKANEKSPHYYKDIVQVIVVTPDMGCNL